MGQAGQGVMRWDCTKQGCFNTKKRLKMEVFNDCFPGRINFGDVDAIVEINGRGLMLEWKPAAIELATGQRLMHERLSRTALLTIFDVAGDAETMTVTHYSVWFDGKNHGWQESDLDGLKARIRRWVAWAKGGI